MREIRCQHGICYDMAMCGKHGRCLTLGGIAELQAREADEHAWRVTRYIIAAAVVFVVGAVVVIWQVSK